MRTRIEILALAVAIAAICGCSNHEEPIADAPANANEVKRPNRSRMKRPVRNPRSERDAKPTIREKNEIDDLTSAEEAQIEKINELLEAEDAQATYALTDQIRKSKNAEVREEYVKSLGWFGEEALPELTLFIDDTDESVAIEAHCQWMNALYSIEDEPTKGEVIRYAMCNLANKDLIEDVATEINSLDNKLGLGIILDAIESGNSTGVAAAKDAYETMTGDEFTNVKAAEKWLAEQDAE